MDCFSYSSGTLCCENVTAESVVTEVGTPLYLYSTRTIRHQFQAIKSAFCDRGIEPLVCYSVKANSNLAILSIFLEMGSGFDVVSLAELRRVIEVTGDLSRTVHAGVAKGDDEIALSLEERVMILNVESRGGTGASLPYRWEPRLRGSRGIAGESIGRCRCPRVHPHRSTRR